MKIVDKSLRPKFNEQGRKWGLLLVTHPRTNESLTLWSDRVEGVRTQNGFVIVEYRQSSNPHGPRFDIPLAVNYDVFMKALLIADQTKYTLDIRPICNFPKTDRYSEYNGGVAIPTIVENRLLRMIRASRITNKRADNNNIAFRR